MLYFDQDCDGRRDGLVDRWILDGAGTQVSTTAESDLDGDGFCFYAAYQLSDGTEPPSGTYSWSVVCDGSWTAVDITVTEVSVPCYEFVMHFSHYLGDDDYDDGGGGGWKGGQTYIIREVPNGTVSNANAIVASGALMEGQSGTDSICLDVGCYTLEVTSDANYVDWEYQVINWVFFFSAALMLLCLVIACCGCFFSQHLDRYAAGITATAPSGEVMSTEMRVNCPVRMNTSFVSASEERPNSYTPPVVVTIPPGAVPGMAIEVRTPTGHVLMVPVSHGMAPGTSIQVNYSGSRVDSISILTSGMMGDPLPGAPAQQPMVVTVPHGMGPGRAIQAQTPTGQVMMVTVPHGMGPGMAMRVNY